METLTAEQIKHRRPGYLALSVVTLLFLGLIYAFSMFSSSMCEEFGLDRSAISITFYIMMITFILGAIIESLVEKVVGFRGVLVLAAVLVAAGFVGTALLGHSIAAVYFFYGVVIGLGVGFGYNAIITTTNLWFPDKIGLASGFLMMGFGLGSLVLGLSALWLIGVAGVSTTFIVVGLVTAVVVLAESFVVKRPQDNIADLLVPSAQTDSASASTRAAKDVIAPTTAIFYAFWIWASLIDAVGLATIGNCASDAQLAGLGASMATVLVGVVGVFNGVGRLFVGFVYDKTNVKVTMLLDALVAVAAVACIIGAMAGGQPLLYIVGALCCGLCYGGVPVVTSAFARQSFGARNYPLNLSLCNIAVIWASLINIGLLMASGGVRLTVFGVLAVLAVLVVVDMVPFAKLWNKRQAS